MWDGILLELIIDRCPRARIRVYRRISTVAVKGDRVTLGCIITAVMKGFLVILTSAAYLYIRSSLNSFFFKRSEYI